MAISSRTPEGEPLRCPVCDQPAEIELSDPAGDAVCPHCGHLLWGFRDRVRDRLARILTDRLGFPFRQARPDSSLRSLGLNSLDLIEVVMELEEEIGITLPDREFERVHTVADLKRLITSHRGD